jgi:hypothetical protein
MTDASGNDRPVISIRTPCFLAAWSGGTYACKRNSAVWEKRA